MNSTLWAQDSFINANIPYVFNKEIIEYDMKEAGFSLTKEYQLLQPNVIDKLDKMKKDKRKIELGLIQRNDETYKNALKEAFKEARRLFFEANEIDDNDIISIKKDAILVMKTCKYQEFGTYINFRPKHIYTSYIQFGKRIEFYYNPNELDIKGYSDETIKLHENYMIKFIKQFFQKMETSDDETVLGFTKRFIDKYKRKELEVGYYRTFNHESKFVLIDDDTEFTEYWEEEKEHLDISYNFQNVLLKLVQIPL